MQNNSSSNNNNQLNRDLSRNFEDNLSSIEIIRKLDDT
jgi:hypothetical protein